MTYAEALDTVYGLFEPIELLSVEDDPEAKLKEINFKRQEIHQVADSSPAASQLRWALTGLDDAFMKACAHFQVEVPLLLA